ncbi:MAG: translocation/assembly module TamB domain-containing protein [Candidatus Babeliales bacterium]|nr:translocation/assembly module TamB domain-containing protein [Candidatus Babeliales bacterium]
MNTSLSADIDFKVTHINIFFPFVKIEKVQVKPLQNTSDWYWHCKKISVSISWIDILFTKCIQPKIVIDNLEAYTQARNGDLLIGPHFQKLLFSGNDQPIPVIINDLKLNKSNFIMEDKDLDFKFQIRYDCQTTEIDKILQNRIYLNGGSIICKNVQYCNNISGLVHLGILYSGAIKNFSLDGLIELNHLSMHENKCFFVGKWQSDADECLIRFSTIDGKSIINLLMSGIKETEQKLSLSLRSPISTFQKILQLNYGLEADFQLDANLDINNLQNFKGVCKVKKLQDKSGSVILDDIKINFNKNLNAINSNIIIDKKDKLKLLGELNFDLESKVGNLVFKNELGANSPNSLFLSLLFNHKLEYSGEFNYNLFSTVLNQQLKSRGQIKGSTQFLDINSNLDDQEIDLKVCLQPYFKIDKFLLTDNKKNECLNIVSDIKQVNNINAIFNCNNIKNWLSNYINCFSVSANKQLFLGDGKLELDGNCTHTGFNGVIKMRNANLVIPEIHNVINNIAGKIDLNIKEKKIIIQDLLINFYKGQLECKQLTIIFDDTFQIIKFVHFPLVIKNFFINWENIFLTNITGRLLVQKEVDKNIAITGNIGLDKSEIKDNIFSPDFRKSIFNQTRPEESNIKQKSLIDDININVSLFTKSAIKIKTAFFKSLINLDLKVVKEKQIDLQGDINLIDGEIIFPYKALKITNANIKFLPGQIDDPIINIIAKNKIKGYAITLQAMGSAQNPHILLESNPTLKEEQIISLLLIGSESSLNLVIPALLSENIKNMVLGSAQYQEKLKKHFSQILLPFKHVRFIPAFHDALGGKGLTATLDIEVNDRLSASIQNNFTTFEQARVEVDYSLTDDVVLRGVQDEVGNLSGEVEMRWKF